MKDLPMGGINHQSCSKYLGESTRLSRFVSLGRAHFELSNVALEDVILTELGEGVSGKGSIGPMRHELQLSQDHILAALSTTDALENKMRELGYADLSQLHQLDLDAIGVQLENKGMVDLATWKDVSRLMKRETFYGNLRLIRGALKHLLKLTQDLLGGVNQLADSADDGTLHLVVDENRPGNIKEPFARLYTAWNDFHQVFLASSLVSTEVWYANQAFGSLATGPVAAPAIQA